MGFDEACQLENEKTMWNGYKVLHDRPYALGDIRPLREWLDENFFGLCISITHPSGNGWGGVPIGYAGKIVFKNHGTVVEISLAWTNSKTGDHLGLFYFDANDPYKLALVDGKLRLQKCNPTCCCLF